ncbi:PREDICTED: chaperone protein dnaJ 11, chloroplastic-like [Ipomoea nil]|uniref:chaperone protein dnaJ 11, chloroplastic-like n=1 Tax=Ipomoea nil TaxID=35883 RepID=UPI000901DE82|nr:PREDICTED: chaperone protein dnaJ 11, chloroplastic-like [Ipomoea nil]
MASTSASFLLSSPFVGSAISAAEVARPRCVSFRRPVSVSASCATAERTAQTPQSSLYDVLGIRTGASGQEIKAAYRRLARVLHPDVASGSVMRESAAAAASPAEDFIRVHAAYSTLSDPEKRANYDRSLLRSRHPAASVRGYSGRRSALRKWETDQCW